MTKPVLGKSVRSDWFFLGRDFAVRTVSMETVQAVYFCFGAKPANSKFATKTAKKNVNIVIFHSETARKSLKDCRIFTEISKMEEEDEHSPSEVSIILNIWKLLMQRHASTKARMPKTVLSTNRKVQTA